MSTIYVLKDEQDHYVSENSIYYDKKLNKVRFMYSSYLTNGFYYSLTKIQNLIQLGKLETLNEKYNLGKTFRVDEIDRIATLFYEHSLNVIKVGVSSIKCEYIDVVKVVPPCKVSDRKCVVNRDCCPCPYKIA